MDENLYEQIKPISCYQVSLLWWNQNLPRICLFQAEKFYKSMNYVFRKPAKIVKNFLSSLISGILSGWLSLN